MELAIPASLHDSLMARLDRTPEVKEIAQIAACIGREFDHALLAAVADRPPVELAAALDKLGAGMNLVSLTLLYGDFKVGDRLPRQQTLLLVKSENGWRLARE